MPAPTASALIDAVDDQDHVVGRVARRAAPTSGSGFRTAHVFVRDGSLLLLQRLADSRERHAGRWGSSVAGYLHAGETYQQAAERRQWEELGLRGPLREVGKTRFPETSATKFVMLFETWAGASDVTLRDPEQVSELRWWHQEEVVDALTASPDEFTPTFQHLFEEFGAGRDRPQIP